MPLSVDSSLMSSEEGCVNFLAVADPRVQGILTAIKKTDSSTFYVLAKEYVFVHFLEKANKPPSVT
jgi:hypothetical protein